MANATEWHTRPGRLIKFLFQINRQRLQTSPFKCDKSDCKQRRTLHLRAQGDPMLRGLPIATKAWRPPGVDTGGSIVLVAETDTGCIFGASGVAGAFGLLFKNACLFMHPSATHCGC